MSTSRKKTKEKVTLKMIRFVVAGLILCIPCTVAQTLPILPIMLFQRTLSHMCFFEKKRFVQKGTDSSCLFLSHSLYLVLYVGDFDAGTVILNKPGKYMLAEDISFCPKVRSTVPGTLPMDAFDPIFPSIKYDEHAFALGFSSAIAITGDNIELYLNGKTMKQCEGHLLMQRFFAHIALALTPFTANEGPHNFVNPKIGFQAGKNVLISGPGTLGRSSHHGKNTETPTLLRDINEQVSHRLCFYLESKTKVFLVMKIQIFMLRI
jgi:hypothetical protein